MRGQARGNGVVRAGRVRVAPRWWQIAFIGCFLALSLLGAAAARQIVDHAGEHSLGEGLAAYKRGDYATVMRLLRPLADQGMAVAQFSLGVMYANGMGAPQDATQAVNWFRKAADQGNADAQANLGAMYDKGQGVSQDFVQAVNWFRRAADHGNADAQASLGWMYAQGQGVPQDFVQAVHWSFEAAQQGNVHAQVNLGIAYQNGTGVERDFREAAKWLLNAAEQGDVYAQANLGWLYANGQGVALDDTQALMWSTWRSRGRRTTQREPDDRVSLRRLSPGLAAAAGLTRGGPDRLGFVSCRRRVATLPLAFNSTSRVLRTATCLGAIWCARLTVETGRAHPAICR